MSVSDARKVKLALNGAEIYTGCCRLSIQYAKVNMHKQTNIYIIVGGKITKVTSDISIIM